MSYKTDPAFIHGQIDRAHLRREDAAWIEQQRARKLMWW